jgi:hypothetical protein
MKRVPVKFSPEVMGLALIDDEDYDLVKDINWSFRSGYVCGGARSYMHRLVMGLERGDGKVVDHINRNRLDNRKSNLRVGTQAQNNTNLPLPDPSAPVVRLPDGRLQCLERIDLKPHPWPFEHKTGEAA